LEEPKEIIIILERLNEIKRSGYGELTLKVSDHKLTHMKKEITEIIK
jgi:hypothetical protein